MSDSVAFEGGLEALDSINDAINPYDAVGRWWARAILSHTFNNSPPDQRMVEAAEHAQDNSVALRPEIERVIGGFAHAVAFLSKEDAVKDLKVDYHPDEILQAAAILAGMPDAYMRIFPWKSRTKIRDGVVFAKLGEGERLHQVWPPEKSS